jgi:hypothetical protein
MTRICEHCGKEVATQEELSAEAPMPKRKTTLKLDYSGGEESPA